MINSSHTSQKTENPTENQNRLALQALLNLLTDNNIEEGVSLDSLPEKIIEELFHIADEEPFINLIMNNLASTFIDDNEKDSHKEPLTRLIEDKISTLQTENITIDQYRKHHAIGELAFRVLNRLSSTKINEEELRRVAKNIRNLETHLRYLEASLEAGVSKILTDEKSSEPSIGKNFLQTPMSLIRELIKKQNQKRLLKSDIITRLIKLIAAAILHKPLTTGELQKVDLTVRDVLESRVVIIGPEDIRFNNAL